MPPSDSKALNRPPTISWGVYRRWTRENLPLWLWHIVFLAALVIVAQQSILNAIYVALVLFPALLVAGPGDYRTVLGTWTVRACLAFLVFMALTPLWTGGIGEAPWVDVTLATAAAASFVTITAHLVATRPEHMNRLLQALAVVALAMALYSAISEYQTHWFSEPLAMAPWPDPATGAAVIGLLLTGVAVGSGMNQEEWPGVRLIYWAVAGLLALLLVMTQSTAAMLGVGAAALAVVAVRPPKLGPAAIWVAGAAILFGLGLFFLGRGPLGDNGGSIAEFWRLVQNRFWLGLGVQTEGRLMVWHAGSYVAAPDNMAMTALVYGGVIAVALLAALYVAMIVVGVRNGRRGLSPAPLAIAVYAAVHGLFATSFVTLPGWQWLALWLPVGIVAGAELSGRKTAA